MPEHDHELTIHDVRTFTMDSNYTDGGDTIVRGWSWEALTEDVLQRGIVTVHWRHDSAARWRSLPDVFQWTDLVTAEVSYTLSPGYFYVLYIYLP